MQKNPAGDESADGRLILAWANLGSLVEGTLKFFLCVYAHDYSALPATKGREKEAIDPDELKLEPLKQYFIKNVWLGQNRKRWGRFIDLVQRRRNAIHSYQDREIGTLREFYVAVKTYLVFLKSTDDSVPYPDAEQEPTS